MLQRCRRYGLSVRSTASDRSGMQQRSLARCRWLRRWTRVVSLRGIGCVLDEQLTDAPFELRQLIEQHAHLQQTNAEARERTEGRA